jgi:hypothetical protein
MQHPKHHNLHGLKPAPIIDRGQVSNPLFQYIRDRQYFAVDQLVARLVQDIVRGELVKRARRELVDYSSFSCATGGVIYFNVGP